MAAEETLGTGRTGGRDATTGVIPGRYALAVGMPELPAPRGWAWTPLSSLAELESGHTPSRKHPEYWDGSIPWIGIKDAVQNHGRTIDDTIQHVTELGLANSSARLLPKDTVCLSRTASVGYVVVMGRPMATSQDFVNWVCGPRLIPQFLKYVLVAENEALWRFARGTTHQTIYYPEAKAFHVCLPPLDEQRTIANILGTLDDKIELNRRMNETLEAMARAIFKSWFVDFDPVRAKASGEPTESICRRLGLTPDLLALFPDRLVDSELGEIPEGWVASPLPEVFEVNPTRTLRKGARAAYLDMANMPTTVARALSYIQREFGSGTKFQNGDTLVARITPCLENGKTCFVDFLEGNQVGWGSTEYLVFHPKPPLPNEFAYFLARTEAFRNHAIANMTGTSGRQRVPASAFDGFRIAVPSADIAGEFGRFASAVIRKMRGNDSESRILSEIRDTLLPKLLSGEIRVPMDGAT